MVADAFRRRGMLGRGMRRAPFRTHRLLPLSRGGASRLVGRVLGPWLQIFSTMNRRICATIARLRLAR